jgi:cytochrome P450
MLSAIATAVRVRLALLGAGFGAIGALLPPVLAALPASDRGARLGALLAAPASQRRIFALLRAFWPNLVLSRKLIAAYENTGTAIVTRHADVTEVLEREADFAVVYEPKMRLITAGENFFLGMQDGPDYTRDVSLMRLAVRREDVPGIVLPIAAAEAAAIVAAHPGRIDAAAALTRVVPARIVARYFGVPGTSEPAMIAGTTAMFWYLFADLAGTEAVERQALAAAAELRDHLDGLIAARKAAPGGAEDVLARCLALQAAGAPGADDLGIRNNLVGLLIGLVPTLSKASVLALDQLLDRPEALAAARAAARAGDDARLAGIVFEALRFEPLNPIIYRRANRDSVIARGTLRARRIPAGTMVLAANLSAMFDPFAVEAPEQFRPGRPWGSYMLWGYGMHACFGAHINRAVIPQILKPLLARPGLRRAAGPEGRPDGRGSPFPAHITVEYDPG